MVTIANYKVGVRDEDGESRCLWEFIVLLWVLFLYFLLFLQETTGQHSNALGIQLLKLVGI